MLNFEVWWANLLPCDMINLGTHDINISEHKQTNGKLTCNYVTKNFWDNFEQNWFTER